MKHRPSTEGDGPLGRERHDRERRVRELQTDPRFDPLRRRSARRALVVLGYALALASGVTAWMNFDFWLGGMIAPTLLLAGVGIAFVLYRTLRNTMDAPDEALDERLIVVRDAAHRRGFLWVTWAMLAALMALVLAGGAERHQLEALAMTYALVSMLTPTAIVAWEQTEV